MRSTHARFPAALPNQSLLFEKGEMGTDRVAGQAKRSGQLVDRADPVAQKMKHADASPTQMFRARCWKLHDGLARHRDDSRFCFAINTQTLFDYLFQAFNVVR